MYVRLAVAICIAFLSTVPSIAQLSLITFLHNSAEPQLRTADLYVTQVGSTTKIEDINFQSANNLNSVFIFGDIEVTFAIAPGSSINAGEAIAEYTFMPAPDKGYMVILNGVKTPASYVVNPNGKNIGLSFISFLVESEVADPNKSGLYFVHGSTDLEGGDIWIRGATTAAVPGIQYGNRSLTPTITDRKQTTIDFTKTGDKTKLIASFGVDFASLGSSIVVCVLSGFKTPDANAGSTDTLSLLSVLEDGRVVKSPLIAGSQTSRVQFVHNAADPALTTIDVWVNGVKAYDNIGFRKSFAFSSIPANTPVVIGFAPATSSAYRDTLRTITLDPLRPGRTYSFIASGVLDSTKFRRNPNNAPINLNVFVLEGALEQSSEAGKTSVRAGHYSTDTRNFTLASSTTIYGTSMTYGVASPSYNFVAPELDTIWVLDSGSIQKKGYVCDLRGTNKAFLLLASGFDRPDSNMNGPAFKLILVDASGTVNSNLQEILPGPVSVLDEIDITDTWSVGPNPLQDVLNVSVPAAIIPPQGSVRAELISMTGLVVGSTEMTSNGASYTASIAATSLASGTYRLRVVALDGSILGSKGLVVTR
ncbi:MAG: DUF4397 domain-containing protein [Candidatus Kapabacteria bacterium]|nr:DUF4397 domain-containing protein [Candidatus Kapabacteria bacterium]